MPWFPDAHRHPESRETTPRCGLHRAASRGVIAAVRDGTGSVNLATKEDLKAEIAALRSELRQAELRLEAKIEAIKSDILNRAFGLILGTLMVNIMAIVGAMFVVAKLVGH